MSKEIKIYAVKLKKRKTIMGSEDLFLTKKEAKAELMGCSDKEDWEIITLEVREDKNN